MDMGQAKHHADRDVRQLALLPRRAVEYPQHHSQEHAAAHEFLQHAMVRRPALKMSKPSNAAGQSGRA
jgi:hypothetical protein